MQIRLQKYLISSTIYKVIFLVDKNYISTINHIRFDPTCPEWNDIEIGDIAHALSYISRANGHFMKFFSVARHCLNCAEEARARGYSERVQLLCLLHDAAEAYIGDMTRPLKKKIPEFSEIERAYQKIIFSKFISEQLTDDERAKAREIDDAMLYHEFLKYNGEILLEYEPELHIDIDSGVKSVDETKAEFLEKFAELSRAVKG